MQSDELLIILQVLLKNSNSKGYYHHEYLEEKDVLAIMKDFHDSMDKDEKTHIEEIPELRAKNFHKILEKNSKRFIETKEQISFHESFVNSVCCPEVVELIRLKLLEGLSE